MTIRQMQKNTERISAKSVCNFAEFSVYQWDLAPWVHTPFIPTYLAAPRILKFIFFIRKNKPVKPVKYAKNSKKYMEQWNSHC